MFGRPDTLSRETWVVNGTVFMRVQLEVFIQPRPPKSWPLRSQSVHMSYEAG